MLQVPSAVVPEEHNFLVNPLHPDFEQLTIGDPEPFEFDERLVDAESSRRAARRRYDEYGG